MVRTSVGDWLMLGDMDTDLKLRHRGSHLACFHGGNWIMGGQLLNNQTIVDYGLQLTDACINTYAGTATNIGPNGFAFISEQGTFTGGSEPTEEQKAFNEEHGYYITGKQYLVGSPKRWIGSLLIVFSFAQRSWRATFMHGAQLVTRR